MVGEKLDKLFSVQVFVFEMEAMGMRGWEEGVKEVLKLVCLPGKEKLCSLGWEEVNEEE